MPWGMSGTPTMPSDVSDEVGVFDRFASLASEVTSRAPFFAACVLLVFVWLPTYFLFSEPDTWQLVINTVTTIVTFELVALFQNAQHRADLAVQHKLNAIAKGLADLMDQRPELDTNQDELRSAVGLEDRESSD